ncbi:MAG: helix-turn-helix domain-containing protein, partial [Promethearchaeota archaeon]
LSIYIHSADVLSIDPISGEKISKLIISIQKTEKKLMEINLILSWLKQKSSIISANIYIDSKQPMIIVLTSSNLIIHTAQTLDIEIKYPITCNGDFQSWQLLCSHAKMKLLTTHFSKNKVPFSLISVIPKKFEESKSLLTPRQAQIYNLAVEMGYFDYPRRITLSRLASVAKVSPSTISVMMRRILVKINIAF